MKQRNGQLRVDSPPVTRSAEPNTQARVQPIARDAREKLQQYPLANELLNTNALERLAGISFLGAIDWLAPKSARSGSRLEHSVAVAYLAICAAEKMDLSESEFKLILSSALLHDVGHPPLSHTTERLFASALGMNHRAAGAWLNDHDDELQAILHDHGVDAKRLKSLAWSKNADPFSFFFHAPINFDTIEGILRSASYFGLESPKITWQPLLSFLIDPNEDSQDAADDFWRLKSQLYNDYIYAPEYFRYDLLCECALDLSGDITLSDYWGDDRALLIKIAAGFLDRLPAFETCLSRFDGIDTMRPMREFRINRNVTVTDRGDIRRRYVERKSHRKSRSMARDPRRASILA